MVLVIEKKCKKFWGKPSSRFYKNGFFLGCFGVILRAFHGAVLGTQHHWSPLKKGAPVIKGKRSIDNYYKKLKSNIYYKL